MTMKAETFPVTVTEKGVSAMIRKTEKIKAGQKHTYFIVEYILKGRRKQVWRSDLEAAKDVARDACIAIGNGVAVALELSDRDRFAYLRAKEILTALGVPLDVAASDYAAAVKVLPPGTTLKEAADFFRAKNPTAREQRTVQQVADEMLAVKRAAQLSDVHLKDLESRLNRIASDFQQNISGVSGVMIQTWLDALDVRGRTKQNYLRVFAALLRFAIASPTAAPVRSAAATSPPSSSSARARHPTR